MCYQVLKDQHTQMKDVCTEAHYCNSQETPCSQCGRGHCIASTMLSEHVVAHLAKLDCVSGQAYLLQAMLSQALLLQQGVANREDIVIH